jgi:molecular chaperone GrpE
VLECFADI